MGTQGRILAFVGLAAAAGLVAIIYGQWRRRQEEEDRRGAGEDESSGDMLTLPVIDFDKYNARDKNKDEYRLECDKVAQALHKYGVCVVRDPRVKESDNNRFLDMMERYFEISDGIRDARPEFAFQVGVTPEFTGKQPHSVHRLSLPSKSQANILLLSLLTPTP
jgi:hypothetical protein